MKVVTDAQPVGETPAEPTKAYRLQAGKRHTHNGRALSAGDVVHLSERQSLAFSDRFEPVDPKAKFEVHDADDVADDEETNDTHEVVQPSGEFSQALRDKASAEAKASGSQVPDGKGHTRTVDGAKGTIHADPDGVAAGRRSTKKSNGKKSSK
jgi:hypothetical protein